MNENNIFFLRNWIKNKVKKMNENVMDTMLIKMKYMKCTRVEVALSEDQKKNC